MDLAEVSLDDAEVGAGLGHDPREVAVVLGFVRVQVQQQQVFERGYGCAHAEHEALRSLAHDAGLRLAGGESNMHSASQKHHRFACGKAVFPRHQDIEVTRHARESSNGQSRRSDDGMPDALRFQCSQGAARVRREAGSAPAHGIDLEDVGIAVHGELTCDQGRSARGACQ